MALSLDYCKEHWFITSPTLLAFISSLLLLIYTLSFNQKHLLRHLITSFLAAGLAFIIIYWPYTGSSGKSLSLINFALVFYVIHAFHMAIHEENKIKVSYPSLFYAVWDSFSLFLVGLLFLGIAWALLATTGKIFSLVNVLVVSSFIYKPQVSLFLSILFFSAGVAIGHDTQKIVRSIRHVVLLMARLLPPFITIIGIIFTMVAIFMTSQRQLSGSTIEWITLTIMAIAIIFLNAFYQEGESYKLYPVAIQQTVNVFFLILPVYAIFGLLSFFPAVKLFGILISLLIEIT
ncbi:hypothetical protein [Coxiella burnetii]|uniref:hypothetical protein n=1 Tax=Coxiella burnetii TaxID=777 RepID=UPI001E4A2479|nr:hypothetical protein [Coxiella burnetii]